MELEQTVSLWPKDWKVHLCVTPVETVPELLFKKRQLIPDLQQLLISNAQLLAPSRGL